MQALQGITVLLVLQSVGELVSRWLHLPLPGPVVGMLLLLLTLQHSWVQGCVAAVAEFLLSHLSLLFVPVGVGVMTHLGLVHQYGVRIGVVVVVSTWVSLAVTAWVLRALMQANAQDTEKAPPS
jgi:holin-like protein